MREIGGAGRAGSMTSKDSFSIDIVLRHPSYSPERISEALSIKPQGFRTAGNEFEGLRAKWTSVYARLREGSTSSAHETALADVVLFLEKNAAFWTDFTSGNGEVELVLNYSYMEKAEHGDLCLELHLEPRLLAQLSSLGIGLRVQAWAN